MQSHQPWLATVQSNLGLFQWAPSTILLALWAFERQEGPAERAGRQLDDATAKAGQQIERAGEKIQDAAKRAKQ